jgi:hypothetical protein
MRDVEIEAKSSGVIILELEQVKWQKFVIRGPLEKFVDWRQCAAVMQRET